jgi:hypothetical protein
MDRALASGANDEKSQPLQKQELNENTNTHSSICSTFSVQKYPELEQVIATWPNLSEQDRKAILDIVKRK